MSAYTTAFANKGIEAFHLLSRGGTIVCLLQPPAVLTGVEISQGNFKGQSLNQYDWLPVLGLSGLIHAGMGERITKTRSSPFDDYLKLDRIRWLAHLIKHKNAEGFEILATNLADYAVACRIRVGLGSIFLLPYTTHQNFREVILNGLTKASGGRIKRRPPDWVGSWVLPGEEDLGNTISGMTQQIVTLQSKSQELRAKLYELSSVKNLLYERDTPLEEATKAAFKEMGLNLEKEGDKDFVSTGTERVIFEVTGSEGSIDVDKFRQLLDYLMTDKLQGNSSKSILIGNHYINLPPEKRGEPFTQKAIAQSKVHDTCLLPTLELYKAIVLIRNGKMDPKQFWKALLDSSGVFKLDSTTNKQPVESKSTAPLLTSKQ